MTCKHVFILGIDGVGTANCLVPTPNLDRVFSSGCYTPEAQSVIPTISAQCWGSILTGVLPHRHGLTNEIVEARPYPIDADFPTLFRILRQQEPTCELASFCGWEPINNGIVEHNLECHLESDADDSRLVQQVSHYLNQHRPRLMFLQLESCDHAGHAHGYFTQGHLDAIAQADKDMGIVLDAIEQNGMWEDSLICLVTDHGGGGEHPYNHGSDHAKDKTVFWGCCGPGIAKNKALQYSLSLPDTAALCLHALGMEIPAYMDGQLPKQVFQEPIT